MVRRLAIMVLLLGAVGIVMGAVFIGLGVARNNELKEAIKIGAKAAVDRMLETGRGR